jgi:hypothetical protein
MASRLLFAVLCILVQPPSDEHVKELWQKHRCNFVKAMGEVKRLPDLNDIFDSAPEKESHWRFLPPDGPCVGAIGVVTSFHVVHIINEDTMNIRNIAGYTGDALMCGMSTTRLTDGKSYLSDEPVAIIGNCQYGSSTVFLAVPVKKIREGISLEEFKHVIASRVSLGPDRQAQMARAEAKEEKRERDLKGELTKKDKGEATGDREASASAKLTFAQTLIDNAKLEKAKERLRELIKQYSDTKAASRAKELLATIPD